MSINRSEIYKGTKYCPHCKLDLTGLSISAIGNHIKWCKAHINKEYQIQIKSKMRENALQQAITRYGAIQQYSVNCYKCNKEFVVEERQKVFPSKEKYYCSRSCANSRQRTTQVKDKISKGVKSSSSFVPAKIRICPVCGKQFSYKNTVHCSVQCKNDHYKSLRTAKVQYGLDCKFRFNLWDYPEQFNLELLKDHGIYKPSNRGNNLKGVSRDHMYSVSQGFQNNVDPTIISHPANCQLLIHTENQSKGGKSKITLEQLLERINKFNKKYNK